MPKRQYYKNRKAAGITTKSVNKQQTDAIAKLQKKVNKIKLDKPELNIIDSQLDGVRINWPDIVAGPGPTTWTAMQIPDPALTTGTSYYGERIGAKLTVKRIEIRGYVKLDQSSAQDSNSVRMVLVRWPRGQAGTIVSVLSNLTSGLAVVSPYNSVTRSEYNVLLDKRIALNKFGGDSKTFSYFQSGNYPVNYVGDGTSIVNGAMYLFIISDHVGSNGPVMDLITRVHYEG